MAKDIQFDEEMEVNSDDSQSDSSSDNEAELELIKKVEELEKKINDNKYYYEGHEELVKLLHQLGDLKSLRVAYERFHNCFPLTPEIWLNWINVEKSIANTENEVKHVFSLFDKAVEDYLSVNLWIEYVQYSIGKSNIETSRLIIERGLRAVGLHAAQGSLLWDTYRELELAHLSLEKEGTEGYNAQLQRIVEVFRRQLSVPLIGMDSTYDEWRQFIDIMSANSSLIKTEPIDWGYQKAKKVLADYQPFEDKLLNSKNESEYLQTYKDYIAAVKDPSTIICIYERASTQLCLQPTIWLDYCHYAIKLGEIADKISLKALRNCNWSEELWIMRLRILEQLQRDEIQLKTAFEEGISNLQAGQGLNYWLAYLDYNNRKLVVKDTLFKLFEQACSQFHFEQDPSSKIARFYARTLAKNGKIQDARRIWKTIFKNPQNKQQAQVWLEFSNLERQYGQIDQVRSIFERALDNCTDWPVCIVEEWSMFEREHGSLENILNCEQKCAKKVELLQLTQSNPVSEEKSRKRKFESEITTEIKRVRVNDDNHSLKSKPLRKAPIVKDPKVTVFISNLYPSINEKRLHKIFPNAVNIELVLDRQGNSRCYGYVQFNKEEEVMVALARDREEVDGRPMFISTCKTDRTERKQAFKYSNEVEKNKLFIKGLPVDKTQEDLELIYNPLGAINIRLVLHKSGQSKGLAYIEFADEKQAEAAMKQTDQMKFGEHTITVAISAPPVKKRMEPNDEKAASSASSESAVTRNSKSRLQVPLVPRQLQVKSEVLAKTGDVKPKSNADFRKMLLNK